ncbi:MAG: hypothetical protein PVH88_24225 [Ignavibacteria bacterium]|jgi:hypothetical protein
MVEYKKLFPYFRINFNSAMLDRQDITKLTTVIAQVLQLNIKLEVGDFKSFFSSVKWGKQ